MKKSVRVAVLCLGSAAMGVLVTLRVPHDRPPSQSPSPPPAAVSEGVKAEPIRVTKLSGGDPAGPPKQTLTSLAGKPALKARSDYDFMALAGPSNAIADRFSDEGRDADWAAGAQEAVVHALDSQSVRAQLSGVEVDCKVTLCRIQATMSLDTLRAMGPNISFSWGRVVGDLMGTPSWSGEFDNFSDVEQMDASLGVAQFTTYLHRRPQGVTVGRSGA